MTVSLLPDVEALLISFLLAQAEVSAIAGTKVGSEIPPGSAFPRVRVRRLAGFPPRSHPLHMDHVLVQLDCYASNKATARALAETSRAVISERLEGSHAAGNVSGVRFGSMTWLPDEDFEPPKPRYVVDVTVFTHL